MAKQTRASVEAKIQRLNDLMSRRMLTAKERQRWRQLVALAERLKRNPVATKKNKKKAKRPAKKNCKTARNKKQTRAKTKKRSTARKKSNPAKNLRAKISQMKPGSWYPTTLSGARVKVQRKGNNSLLIRPAGKKRSR